MSKIACYDKNCEKSPDSWRFKVDAKSRGPFESGDFGENGKFGKNGESGTNSENRQGLAISRMWQISKLDTKSGPWRVAILANIVTGEIGDNSPKMQRQFTKESAKLVMSS